MNKKKRFTTSKILIAFLFLNCTFVELFTCWATAEMLSVVKTTGYSMDFTPLVTLIGAVVGEVIGYAIYSLKALKENSVGGITYQKAIAELENSKDFLEEISNCKGDE